MTAVSGALNAGAGEEQGTRCELAARYPKIARIKKLAQAVVVREDLIPYEIFKHFENVEILAS
jgi:hypothetical protein